MRKRAVKAPESCIYCRSDVDKKSREHVIPEAFGKFEQNWTLTCVCASCNAYFSRALEIPLARDSFEAIQRIEKGLKPTAAAEKLLNRRTSHVVYTDGFFRGARVLLGAETESSLFPVLQPQAGFRLPGQTDWTWILERDLTPEALEPFKSKAFELRIVGDERFDSASICERLRDCGLIFDIRGHYVDPLADSGQPVEIEHVFEIDLPIQRAASKICFNYAAKTLGAESVRHQVFDATRRFVRFGELSPEHPVRAARIPLLQGDADEIAKVNGHLCGMGWRSERKQLVANVSLFNELVYEVVLCTDRERHVSPFFVGHLFDLTSRTIIEVRHAENTQRRSEL